MNSLKLQLEQVPERPSKSISFSKRTGDNIEIATITPSFENGSDAINTTNSSREVRRATNEDNGNHMGIATLNRQAAACAIQLLPAELNEKLMAIIEHRNELASANEDLPDGEKIREIKLEEEDAEIWHLLQSHSDRIKDAILEHPFSSAAR